MLRTLPPSAVPLRLADILSGVFAMRSGEKCVRDFEELVAKRIGVAHAVAVSSGRAGLSLLLQALHQQTPARNEVLIPAFTSYSVPSAVVNAGLKISLYDLDEETLSTNEKSLARAINDKTLCIVVCHLFGYPAEMDVVERIAHQCSLPVIDDAAQSMGARYRGKPLGSFGKAGLFSLSRGKNITAVDGGIVLTSDQQLADQIRQLIPSRPSLFEQSLVMLKALALLVLTHPRFYWIPNNLPFLNIGASTFNPEFRISRLSAFQAEIASRLFARLDKINADRVGKATCLIKLLGKFPDVSLFRPVDEADSVFLRFPMIAHKGKIVKNDLGIVGSYPKIVKDIPGIDEFVVSNYLFPVAQRLAEKLVTLPTHHYVADADIEKIARAVRDSQ
jgi:perosamine synthetase